MWFDAPSTYLFVSYFTRTTPRSQHTILRLRKKVLIEKKVVSDPQFNSPQTKNLLQYSPVLDHVGNGRLLVGTQLNFFMDFRIIPEFDYELEMRKSREGFIYSCRVFDGSKMILSIKTSMQTFLSS